MFYTIPKLFGAKRCGVRVGEMFWFRDQLNYASIYYADLMTTRDLSSLWHTHDHIVTETRHCHHVVWRQKPATVINLIYGMSHVAWRQKNYRHIFYRSWVPKCDDELVNQSSLEWRCIYDPIVIHNLD